MKETEIQKEKSRRTVRGELALMVAVAINSLGVVLCCIPAQASRQYKQCRMHFPKFHTRIAWNLDLYISGTSGAKSHDPAEKICAAVSVQFCSGICIQRIIGCA